MEQHIDLIEDFQREVTQVEESFTNYKTLNKNINKNDSLILYVNIRSLNCNYDKLNILIKRLRIQPYIIVCSETWIILNPQLFAIQGYKLYYNKSKINQNDGVVVYIKEDISEVTDIIEIDRLKILNSRISLNNNSSLEISALYRSHDLEPLEFIKNIKSYINSKRNIKNHLIIGDFNIDIMEKDDCSIELLDNMMEKGFLPGFIHTTRPSDTGGVSTCIDNMYIKATSITTSTFKLSIPFTDHYPLFLKLSKTPKLKKENNHKLHSIASMKSWNVI